MNLNLNVDNNNNGNYFNQSYLHNLESTSMGSKWSQEIFCKVERFQPAVPSCFQHVTVTDHTQSQTLQQSTENIIPLDYTPKEEHWVPSIQPQPSLIANTDKKKNRAKLPIKKVTQKSQQNAFKISQDFKKDLNRLLKESDKDIEPLPFLEQEFVEERGTVVQPLAGDQKFDEFVKILSDHPEDTSEQIKILLAQKWGVQFSSVKRYSKAFFDKSRTDSSMVPHLNDFVNRCVLSIRNRYHRNYPHLREVVGTSSTSTCAINVAKGTSTKARLDDLEAFFGDFQTILRENSGVSAADVEILLAQKNWSPTMISTRIRMLMERASEDESLRPLLEQYISGCISKRKAWYLNAYPYLDKTE